MARGTIYITPLVANAGVAGTTTAIDTSNGHMIISTTGLWRRTIVQVINTGTGIGTVAIQPGAYPPAFTGGFTGTAAGQGTTYITVASGGTAFITIPSANAVKSDGVSVYLDESGFGLTGSIYAFELPAAL